MKTWIISDTHGQHSELQIPRCLDAVIHAGDWANIKDPIENFDESLKFLNWLKGTNVKYKFLISGNHNTAMENLPYKDDLLKKINKLGITYLENSFSEEFKIYGSPYTLEFGRNWAFNLNRNHSGLIYDIIPEETEILITHGPPYGILDSAISGDLIGDMTLRKRVFELPNLKYHIYGHLHEQGGTIKNISGVTFINACVFNLNHSLTNNGIIIDL